MGTITLDDRDSAVLERLREGDADVESLADGASCDPEYLRDRLPDLADNGLVRRVDDDVYRLTENGERAISGSPAGTMDDRIDTPAHVERAIGSFDLRPDRAAAVRNAFAFLKYWGKAHEIEIVDAAYSEHPAGFESSEEWWDDCVRERLAALPGVEAPDAPDQPWRFTGTPTVEKVTDDGRDTADDGVTAQTSVKYALERADLSDAERSAVRAAFEHLARREVASAADLKDEVYPNHDAGYDDADRWWCELVRKTFESLPGVEPAGESAMGQADDDDEGWRYRQADRGPASSEPGADVPDEPLGPDDQMDG